MLYASLPQRNNGTSPSDEQVNGNAFLVLSSNSSILNKKNNLHFEVNTTHLYRQSSDTENVDRQGITQSSYSAGLGFNSRLSDRSL
jgi:hypothetical protein